MNLIPFLFLQVRLPAPILDIQGKRGRQARTSCKQQHIRIDPVCVKTLGYLVKSPISTLKMDLSPFQPVVAGHT
ncbi:hypothetical protein BYT27DRAFT_6333705 [Phlegmacium glaucopus]|nr:hypothetical protein BYT27DRAFT_6333705 [Phlegmacium glaucopus]